MLNEINLLTMSEPEIKRNVLDIAEKFNVVIEHMFQSYDDDGYLMIFLKPTDTDIVKKFEKFLYRFMSGIIDIDNNEIGIRAVDCPAITILNETDQNKITILLREYLSMEDVKKLI